MILLHHPNQRPRTGAIAPLAAIMLVFFMFLVAVAVDLGYVANVRAELQNAADSAALAGASQLLDNNILKGTPDQDNAMANARAQAQPFAGLPQCHAAKDPIDEEIDIQARLAANVCDHEDLLVTEPFGP